MAKRIDGEQTWLWERGLVSIGEWYLVVTLWSPLSASLCSLSPPPSVTHPCRPCRPCLSVDTPGSSAYPDLESSGGCAHAGPGRLNKPTFDFTHTIHSLI